MAKTKLRSASRFGARYSSPLKKVFADVEDIEKRPQECPKCFRKSLVHKNYGIWYCKKCKARIAGGAYQPQTIIGSLAERIVRKGEKISESEIAQKVAVKEIEKTEEKTEKKEKPKEKKIKKDKKEKKENKVEEE